MVRTLQKNRRRVSDTYEAVDVSGMDEERKTESNMGDKNKGCNSREEKNDSGWMEKMMNGNQKT
jgi:hypothetical protein